MKLPLTLLPSRKLVKIESDFDLLQSVERLRDATLYQWGSQELCGDLAGHVSTDRVVISRRQKGYYLNRMQPVFFGKWEERDGKVFLVGRFGFPYDVWVVLAFPLLFYAWLLGTWFWKLTDKDLLQIFIEVPVIVGIGMFGLGIYAACRWFVRDDEALVRHLARNTLRD